MPTGLASHTLHHIHVVLHGRAAAFVRMRSHKIVSKSMYISCSYAVSGNINAHLSPVHSYMLT